MTLLKELQGILPQLSNSRFLAHFLEPILLWGTFLGWIAWMLSLWVVKDRKAQVCSLILLALSAFTIYPLLHFRKMAAPIASPSNALLKKQNERRQDTQWAYYALGSAALLGLFLTGEGKGKTGTFLSVVLIGGGLSVVLLSLWLHEKELSVFHPDARPQARSRG